MILDFHTHPTNHPDLSESLYSIWHPCFSSTKVKENGCVKNNDDSSPASFNYVGSSLNNPWENIFILKTSNQFKTGGYEKAQLAV